MNLVWEDDDIFDGSFNCSDIFEFDQGDYDQDLDDLTCKADDKSRDSALETRVKISSSNEDLLALITKEKITVTLKEDAFTQECAANDDLSYLIDFPASSSSCSLCGK